MERNSSNPSPTEPKTTLYRTGCCEIRLPKCTWILRHIGAIKSHHAYSQPRLLSGLRRSRVHSLMIARRSLCPEKLGSNPGQGSKGITFSGWHGLDMSITVTKRR